MGQYCDSKILEINWFCWLLSSSVPNLECYRKHGLLWTKIVEDNDQILPNPRNPNRTHCIALSVPIYFDSFNGDFGSFGTTPINNKQKEVNLPQEDELSLCSDSWLHRLDDPFIQSNKVIPKLKNDKYILEQPTEKTWHAMLRDINEMCQGIATRFKQPSEEEQLELANEALLQVTNKLASYKLIYTPGLAPVFNLLTTTIFRCMYSIMNRRKIRHKGQQQFANDVQAGIIPKYK